MTTTNTPREASKNSPGSYALVNGLKMYYEVHGTGKPLVLLHGGLMILEAFGPLIPALAQTRQVIAVELEGHGRTLDLDRPLRLEQMAEDVAGLIRKLGIAPADIFGYSMGGGTALHLAYRHPDLVRKLVLVSAAYSNDGFYADIVASWPAMTAEALTGTPMEQAYLQVAPDPQHWPALVEKIKESMVESKGLPAAAVQSIQAPALLVYGDTDLVRPEYAVEMFRLLGGRPNYFMGQPAKTQLAILPATSHYDIFTRADLLLPLVTPFLDTP